MIRDNLLATDETKFFEKYIESSKVWYFQEILHVSPEKHMDLLDEFKRAVSRSFNVDMYSIRIVGSAKTGLSFSPKKNFREFIVDEEQAVINNCEVSDIDIAIISTELFNGIWKQLKDYSSMYRINRYRYIAHSFFNGFINEKALRNQTDFVSDLFSMSEKSSLEIRDEYAVIHPINYRIYNSSEDFKRYHINGIRSLKGGYLGEV